MKVLVTGGNGMVGTAIIDNLGDQEEYKFRPLDIESHPDGDRDTVVASVENYDEIRPAFDGVDAVIHLAVYAPGIIDENWERIRSVNIEGTRNVLRAAQDAEVERVIFASTNHVVGMYEEEYAPDLYELDHDLLLDHTSSDRPDSSYGVSKLFGENDGRFFVENMEYPRRFYAIRICSLREPAFDHPYGDAEKAVENGEFERGSDEYEETVRRMKAMWLSRRDCAHLVNCILQDEDTEYAIFSGVSDNDRRWFDIEHARNLVGYAPRDNGESWNAPPE
ncbi:NAD-dependent epimerase/dehydratase family protein [Natrinema gelatinilyticum]|uniref:NAD-dependent epimerase/dehydratase family protein n=1 Tax=Natrinema gelatinilyticum TaxID=2961571 RepID=UPI0020C5760F|nr:NAD(P)-dependent oxidoreductase [Natrinema gelatinilyticum]